MTPPQKPTELIYVPPSSAYPALVAVGLAAVIVGLFAWWPYSVAGALIALISLVAWLRSNRAEISNLPNEQATDTAPIPLR
jgi:hypothetical protein